MENVTVLKGLQINKAVKFWLIIGLVMVFFQVVIGGITRLTGSGLSITEWEIVTGTFPPTNTADWQGEFEKYQKTPQYEKINVGMALSDFKFIYFWEYFHRLWARTMGFVFIIPFVFFWRKGWLPKPLMKRLGIVVAMAAVVASFGWIMVASGLVDRPWVNAYKLTLHLSLAFILFSYLLWTTFHTFSPNKQVIHNLKFKKAALFITIVVAIQIILGGLMSGMKAGLYYPTFPDMAGEVIPEVMLISSEWNVENLKNYDSNKFMPALVQFVHRGTAYLLTVMILVFFFSTRKLRFTQRFSTANLLLVSMLVIQVLLGILTIINCKAVIPVGLGVSHQAGALLLLSIALWMNYQFSDTNLKINKMKS
jgi:cytochrome c oxidase assembly protein subunit 15